MDLDERNCEKGFWPVSMSEHTLMQIPKKIPTIPLSFIQAKSISNKTFLNLPHLDLYKVLYDILLTHRYQLLKHAGYFIINIHASQN